MKHFILPLLVFSTLSLTAQQIRWDLMDVVKTGSISISPKGEVIANGPGTLSGYFSPTTGNRITHRPPYAKNSAPGKRTFQKNGFVTKSTDWTTDVGLPNSPDGQYSFQFYEENYSLAATSDGKIITCKPSFKKANYYGRKGYNDEKYCHKLTGLQVKDVRTNTVIKDITTDVIADWETLGEYEFHLNHDETRLIQVNKKSGAPQLVLYNLESGEIKRFPLDYSLMIWQESKDLLMCITYINNTEQGLYVWDTKSGTQLASMKTVGHFPQMELADGRLWKVNKEAAQLTEYGFKNGLPDSITTHLLDLTPYKLTGKIEQMRVATGGVVVILPAKNDNKWIFHHLKDKQRSIVFSGDTRTQAEKDAAAAAHVAYKNKLCAEGEQLARQYEGWSYMGPNGRTYILDYNCEYGAFIVGYFRHTAFYGPPGSAKKMPHYYIYTERAYVSPEKLSDDGKRVCTSCHGTPVGTRTVNSIGWTKRYVLGAVYYIKDDVVNTFTQYTMCAVCKGAGTIGK